MAYTPPDYPEQLTHKYWDKKKSLLAKAAGKTGVGEAAKAAAAAYGKIDWYAFNVMNNGRLSVPLNSPDAKTLLRKTLDGVTSDWRSTVKPTIDALHALEHTATTAASGKLAKHKSDAALANQIAKEARILAAALQTNGIFFTEVYRKCQEAIDNVDKMQAEFKKIAGETKTFLAQLLAGLGKVKAQIDDPEKLWETDVKQQGRSVSNNLKADAELAKKHLKLWLTQFKGFDWDTLGYSEMAAAERKAAILKLIGDVQKASAELAKDLH